jgi:TatD DNase family protein
MAGLTDTHAHLQFDAFAGQVPAVVHRATEAGVSKIITVGVDTADSRKAIELAATYEQVWATVGVHPHTAGEGAQAGTYLRDLAGRRKVVAIGECGFDFYRSKTTPEEQEAVVRMQIELALELKLPLIFHVREAFERFFAVIGDYPPLRGVVHSFTAGPTELEQVLAAGLQVALNGIVTFSKDPAQLEAAKQVPVERLLLETDCPYLSPVPYRGKTNEPARVTDIAAFLAELRGEPVTVLSAQTTTNAEALFGI